MSATGCSAAGSHSADSSDLDAVAKIRAQPPRAGEPGARRRGSETSANLQRAMAAGRDDRAGAVLAFDFGAKRIGVAVGDTALRIAHPLATIAAEDNRRRLEAIARLVDEWHPVRFVLGCPASRGAAPHALLPALARFERRLAARFGLPVERVDESLSSWHASRRLSAAGRPAHRQKSHLDAMAACVILEDWLERSSAPRAGANGDLA